LLIHDAVVEAVLQNSPKPPMSTDIGDISKQRLHIIPTIINDIHVVLLNLQESDVNFSMQ